MPQIIYLVYVAIAVGVSAVTVQMIVAAIVELVLIVGSAIYANQQRQKLKAQARGALDQGRQVMSRDGTFSRVIIYGTQKVSGPIAFMRTTGATNEFLHIVIPLTGHEIDSFVMLYIDGNSVTMDGSGNVTTSTYAGFARIKTHTGSPSQVADTDLVSDTGSYWSSTCTLSGIPYIYARIKYSVDVFPNGIPNISALVKGKKVYDPRDVTQSSSDPTTWKWSSNSALCLADYLHDPVLGLNVPWTTIDSTELIASANKCDESVTTLAGSESRFTTNVILDTASTPEDNINVLRWAMVGSLIYSGGVFYVQAGAYRIPTLSFNESHIVGPVSISPRLSRKDLCNAVSGLRVAPEQGYTAVNFQPYIPYTWLTVSAVNTSTEVLTVTAHGLANGTPVHFSSTAALPAPLNTSLTYYVINGTTDTLQVASLVGGSAINLTSAGSGTISLLYEPFLIQDNGERIWLDLELPATSTDSMAQRIAKTNLEIARQQISVSLSLNLSAMQFRAGDNIMLSLTRMGWTNKVFTVADWKLSVSSNSSTAPVPQVEVTLRETASGVWDWNNGEEQAYDLAPDTNLPSGFNPGAPTSLVLTAGSSTAIVQPDGTIVPRLKVAWTAPTDQAVLSGGKIRIEYKNSLDSNYIQWSYVAGDSTFDYITDVQIGQLYDVRIKSENNLGASSTYLSQTNFTVFGDTTAPAAPTGLTAGAGTGAIVQLRWTANTEADLDGYNIYRNSVSTFGTATKIAFNAANAYVDASVSTSTLYYYWITAVDRTGNESGASSVASVTTGGAPALAPGAPANAGLATFIVQGTYLGADGATLVTMDISVPALPTGAAWQNFLYRVNASAAWQISGQLTNSSSIGMQVDDLTPGLSYHMALQAFNSAGVSSSVIEATGSPFTANGDSTAPAVPSGLVAVAGTGKSISLSWTANTEKDFEEYAIYRNTVNTFGSATKIANNHASVYVDVNVSLATTYYYWVTAIDRTDNASAQSSSATATTVAVQDSSVDQTAPSAPSAASLAASGVYNAFDGTTFSYLDISMPALPSGAKVQNLLYRKSGASSWLIASQQANSSTQVARIDDLSPNSVYEVATQAFSFSAVGSTITAATSSPFTAPTKSAGPSACNSPTVISPVAAGSTCPAVNSGGVICYAAQAKWANPADNDVDHYEVKSTATNSSGAVDYTWTGGTMITQEPFYNLYCLSLFAGHTYVRAINRSGIGGTWTYCGNALSVASTPAGDVSLQASTGMAITGVKVGGTSVPQQNVTVPFSITVTLTGGASTEAKAVALPSGFLYKPDYMTINASTFSNIVVSYDKANAGNSASTAWLNFRAIAGVLGAGSQQITGIAGNYT